MNLYMFHISKSSGKVGNKIVKVLIITKIFILLYFFNAINTGWNVAVLSLYAIGFRMFLLKRKEICLNKNNVKQKICNTKEGGDKKKTKNSSCSVYKTIKCNINVNDSNKNVKNFFFVWIFFLILAFSVFFPFSFFSFLFLKRGLIFLHVKHEI